MASKHPLRRSCAFCRARKIKCSNETICEACRKQGADCIYDFEPSRPKVRTTSQDGGRADAATMRGGECAAISQRQPSSTGGSSNCGSPVGTIPQDPKPIEEGESVATALEHKYYENFSSDSGQRSSPWQEHISAYSRSLQNSVRESPDSIAAKFSPKNFKYDGILSLLTHDLVGLVTDRFGSLGCHHVEDGGARFFLSGLVNDETQSMFDDAPVASNPLSEYGQRQQTQLIDVWFSVHPLSFLVSKTLLLRELRDGTHDEILLATMMADANFSIGGDVAIARGHALIRWATAQLKTRPLRPDQSSQNGGSAEASPSMFSGISTRIFSGISTAQALMLMGWNALCSLQVRRATCYIGLSGAIATQIKEHISSTSAPVTSSRINGIDVFDVEKEIVAYLYWTTYSLSLWAFIQMGNGHFSALLPTSLTSIFLPVTEASSVIIQLDNVSENFSTLQKQKSVIRQMWPLAHIASVIAYIYALYPQDGNAMESPTTDNWQEAPLLALQRLQQGKPTQDIACVCREVNRVLVESIHILNRQVTEVSSRSLVLAVYNTMAIHFLFPMMAQGQPTEGISAETIERFCSSTQEILEIFASISEQPQDLFAITPSLRSSFPNVFCLALDTCARALSIIRTKRNTGGLLMDMPTMHAYDGRMEVLANKLYEMSHHDFLTQGKSLRVARKHFKAIIRSFGTRSRSSSFGISSPDSLRTGLSASESDNLSSPAIASAEPTESFVPPTTWPSKQSRMAPTSGATSSSRTNYFSSAEEMLKPEWNTANEIFHNVLDSGALGGATGDHLSVSDLIDLQSMWFPQMPGVTEQWDWPDMAADAMATTSSMDSVLYHF